MTDIVNPSYNRQASSFLTAGTIAYNAGVSDGFVIASADSPTPLANDQGLTVTNLTGFAESSSSSSLDVTIDGGEGFVFGSYVARDVSTTVTLAASTNNQVVYLGWDDNAPDTIKIGLAADFDSTDPKIELYSYDTDGSGVIN